MTDSKQESADSKKTVKPASKPRKRVTATTSSSSSAPSAPVAAAAAPKPAQEQRSVLERIGGEEALGALVDGFCKRVCGDARLNYFLFGTNLAELSGKLKCLAVGHFSKSDEGSPCFAAERKKLQELGLKPMHSEILLKHVGETLKSLSISEDAGAHVMEAAESAGSFLLARKK